MRVSCFPCLQFNELTPIEKISMFRDVFNLLHKDSEELFSKIMESIEKHGSGGHLYFDCGLCSSERPGGLRRYEEIMAEHLREGRRKQIEEYMASDRSVIRNYAKRLLAEDKLKEIGAWPDCRFYGISQRPYLNENFVDRISDEDATLIFLNDFHLKQQRGEYDRLDLLVSLELEFDKLVESFKEILKEKQTVYKEIHKADGRLKLPPFELWDMYIRAFILKVKLVKANLLNPEWPSRKLLKRQEIADLLFGGDYGDNLQKLDRYVKEAKKLINQAKESEGPFKYCT